MTYTASLVLAFSLLVNDLNLLNSEDVLKDKYFASNLVFLLSVCLMLRRVNIIPKAFWRKFAPLCLILEILAAVAVLEYSLIHIWRRVQGYVQANADGLLVHLVERYNLDWLVCHMCCGKSDCPSIFAALVLQASSFVVLVGACAVFS